MQRAIPFVKINGLGHDFIAIDGHAAPVRAARASDFDEIGAAAIGASNFR